MSLERNSKSCLRALQKFMGFMGYESTRPSYTTEELIGITPSDIQRYLNKLAYNKETPGSEDRPVHCRANTLAFVKRSLSGYMPRRLVPWDPISKQGNPTRSEEVNNVIKAVKKSEVRHEGVLTSATRPIEYEELISLLKILRTDRNPEKRHMVCCVICMQWHLIARIDDMMKFQFSNLTFNVQHPFTILAKLRWSKNITEERDAPEQIILGSLEPLLCPILNLAVYLETRTHDSPFVFGSPDHGARVVRAAIQEVLDDSRFERTRPGKLLTHSFRKGSATYASRTGAVKDHVDRRGRWRRKKSTVDIYIDVNLPYPDALVASALTGPAGPCKYKVSHNTHFLTDSVLAPTFAPASVQVLPAQLAKLMATALIWAGMSDHEVPVMPQEMRDDIRAKVHQITGLTDNPVSRVPLHVSGEGGRMHLIEICTDGLRAGQDQSSTLSSSQPTTSDATALAALTSTVLSLKHRIEEINNATQGEIQRTRSDLAQRLSRLQANISRIAIQPVVRSARSAENGTGSDTPARARRKLLGTPKDLYDLWKEFEFGLGGNKPAKCLTSVERGQCRHTYSRRKIFWDLIENLVRKGYTSDVAIDKTYLVYGRSQSVNRILLRMRADRQTGGHPDLR